MPSPLAAIQVAQDAVYANLGVAASWAPSGGVLVPCTALVGGGDQGARFPHMMGEFNVAAVCLRLRVRELAALSNAVPLKGDAVTLGADLATPLADQVAYLIVGDPRHPADDPRRLEWEFDLDLA